MQIPEAMTISRQSEVQKCKLLDSRYRQPAPGGQFIQAEGGWDQWPLCMLFVSFTEQEINRYASHYKRKTYKSFPGPRNDGIDKQSGTEEHEYCRYNRVTPCFVRPVCIRHPATQDEHPSCRGTVEYINGKDEHVGQLIKVA